MCTNVFPKTSKSKDFSTGLSVTTILLLPLFLPLLLLLLPLLLPPSSFSSLLLLLLDLIYIFERKRETSTSWRGTEVEVDSPLSRDPDTWGSIPGHQDHDMSQKLQLTDWPIQELLLTIILFSSSLLNTLKFLNIPRIWVEANLTLSFMVSLHVSKHIVT